MNIYDYYDFRKYLNDYYNYKKANSKGFSYRYFAKRAGFNSGSFLKLVMDGKRNLSEDSLDKFINAMELSEDEATYFRALVGLGQSQTNREKMRFYQECEYLKTVSTWDLKDHISALRKWIDEGKELLMSIPQGKRDLIKEDVLLKGLIEQGMRVM